MVKKSLQLLVHELNQNQELPGVARVIPLSAKDNNNINTFAKEIVNTADITSSQQRLAAIQQQSAEKHQSSEIFKKREFQAHINPPTRKRSTDNRFSSPFCCFSNLFSCNSDKNHNNLNLSIPLIQKL